MTVNEIFENLASHMLKGAMFHEELSNYFGFLNLCCYQKRHEKHFYCELKNYRHICKYYLCHYDKLLKYEHDSEDIIPLNWYRYERQDVDTSTKRNAVKTAIEKWVEWETETKAFYQQMYKELITLNEIATAEKLSCYIHDVSKELKEAKHHHLMLKSVDYDINFIIGENE